MSSLTTRDRRIRPERRRGDGRRRLRSTSKRRLKGTRINLEGEDGGVLVRRGGEGLQALQHLVATAFRKQLGDDNRIVIDCNGFRRDKDAELRQMAHFIAEKARASGMPQEMGPLNPYERRIVHLAIAEDPAVTSESIGDAFMKTVIISDEELESRLGTTDADRNHVCDRRHHRGHRDAARPGAHRRRPAQRTARRCDLAGELLDRGDSTANHATRRSRACSASTTHRRSTKSSRRSFPRRTPTPARTSWRSAPTAVPSCSTPIVSARDRGRRAARRAWRVHAARVPERQARSDSGRSGRRSDRCRDAAAGAGRVRSTRGNAHASESQRSTPRLFDLIARLEASLDFPDEGYHFIEPASAGGARSVR